MPRGCGTDDSLYNDLPGRERRDCRLLVHELRVCAQHNVAVAWRAVSRHLSKDVGQHTSWYFTKNLTVASVDPGRGVAELSGVGDEDRAVCRQSRAGPTPLDAFEPRHSRLSRIYSGHGLGIRRRSRASSAASNVGLS